MKLTIYCDGGSRGNPGQAAVGGLVSSNGKLMGTISQTIGVATNNEAEYSAVIASLDWIINNRVVPKSKKPEIEFFIDSKLVANQLAGEYKIKQNHLKKLALKVYNLLNKLKATANFNYIPREKNQKADALVNRALDLRL